MAGLVPVIHVLSYPKKKDVDAHDKRGHDVEGLALDGIEYCNGFIHGSSKAQAKGA
jgi:hypothetical protein